MSHFLLISAPPGQEPAALPLKRIQEALSTAPVARWTRVARSTWAIPIHGGLCVARSQDHVAIAHARIDPLEADLDSVDAHKGVVGEEAASAILRAYANNGSECVSHLAGDYAAVIVATDGGELVLLRDPFAKRELYHGSAHGWCFVSTLAVPLLRISELLGVPCRHSIANFLLFGYHRVPDSELTGSSGLRSVPPGACMHLSGDTGRVSVRYGFPVAHRPIQGVPASEYPAVLRKVLAAAVSARVTSTRVAISLSGGLDSSSVLALLAAHRDRWQPDLQIFALTNAGGRFDDEARHAAIVASHFGATHFIHDVLAYRMFDPWEPSSLPTGEFLSQAVRASNARFASEAEVVFTGDAGDNVLKGTPFSWLGMLRGWGLRTSLSHLRAMSSGQWRALPIGTGLGAWVGGRQGADPQPTLPMPAWLSSAFVRTEQLDQRWHAFWRRPSGSSVHPFHALLQEAVMWPDWGNAWEFGDEPDRSVPVVDPFLDQRVIRFLLSIPPYPWLQRKHILREAMRDCLPPEILMRPKTPAGDVLSEFLRTASEETIDRLQRPDELSEYVDLARVPRMRAGADATSNFLALRVMILDRWLQHHARLRERAVSVRRILEGS